MRQRLSFIRSELTEISETDQISSDPRLAELADQARRAVISFQLAVAKREKAAERAAQVERARERAAAEAALRERALIAMKGMGDAQRCLLSQFVTEGETTTINLAMLSGVDEETAPRSLRAMEGRGLVTGHRYSSRTEEFWAPTELGKMGAQIVFEQASELVGRGLAEALDSMNAA